MPVTRDPGGLARRRVPPALAFFAAAVLALAAGPASGADFAPITDAERALTAAPGDPEAPAVVLFEKGRMALMEYPKDLYSQLEVEVRVKVLNDRGKEMFGEVEIEHGRYLRLSGFKGRTVLPDGREVPVGEDAVFQDVASRARRRYVTRAAFPAVEPGAILDYRYTLRWDTFLYLEPWYFANRVPTLLSEVTYVVPKNMTARPWAMQVNSVELRAEDKGLAKGTELRIWAENVPAIADEPFSFPFEDLSSRFVLLPLEVMSGGRQIRLLRSWNSVCELVHHGYQEMRDRRGDAKRKARELTAGSTTARAKAEALYRFVRDEIRSDGFSGVFVDRKDTTIDRVLSERRGSSVEQALVLETMLDAAGLEPRLVWAANRLDGRIDTGAANPWWFDRVLVTLELDGERVVLDPSDRDLGFGQLVPGFEGMPALLYHQSRPEFIELPAPPSSDNARRADVALAVDSEGRVTGSGTLTLTGHHAWIDLSLRDGDDPAAEWRETLESSYQGYEVTDVEVADDRDRRTVTVAWKLELREEEALGDEVTLWPSRPIGPQEQPFTLPPERRTTPVQLYFADVEEVALSVTWPEGWSIDNPPPAVLERRQGAAVEQEVEVDEAGRTLTYRRRLETSKVEFTDSNEYGALRDVIAAAAKADAQPLVLSAR